MIISSVTHLIISFDSFDRIEAVPVNSCHNDLVLYTSSYTNSTSIFGYFQSQLKSHKYFSKGP